MIGMASKGLTQTSSLIQISSSVTESAANTFTVEQVDLQLNPLDREVFVVQAVDLDMIPPQLKAGSVTQLALSLSSTRRTSIGGIDEYEASDTPSSNLDYIAIIATNDFFLNLEGAGNASALSANARIYGYRARADAAIYAALVQSEALSA